MMQPHRSGDELDLTITVKWVSYSKKLVFSKVYWLFANLTCDKININRTHRHQHQTGNHNGHMDLSSIKRLSGHTQKTSERNISKGRILRTKTMYRRSNFLPWKRAGRSIYFWHILGPVSISLMIADKSPVTVVSIVLAMFHGFMIHKLSRPSRFLIQ